MEVPETLPSLLRVALSRLESAYQNQGAGRAGLPSLDAWANLLRVLDPGGVDRRQLPTLTRLSKRALRTRVSAAARHGWAETLTLDRGLVVVQLTIRGADAAARWAPLRQAAEKQWQGEIGSGPADALRGSLRTVVADLPLEHPHYPASYGTVDASISGGPGQDWKPVPRQSPDTVDSLPVSSLLSQALVAFALQYEELSPVALPVTMRILRRVPPEGLTVQDLGRSVHLAALERHGFVRLTSARGDTAIFLTASGRAVSDACAGRIEAVEESWRERSGSEVISWLRQVLEESEFRVCMDNVQGDPAPPEHR